MQVIRKCVALALICLLRSVVAQAVVAVIVTPEVVGCIVVPRVSALRLGFFIVTSLFMRIHASLRLSSAYFWEVITVKSGLGRHHHVRHSSNTVSLALTRNQERFLHLLICLLLLLLDLLQLLDALFLQLLEHLCLLFQLINELFLFVDFGFEFVLELTLLCGQEVEVGFLRLLLHAADGFHFYSLSLQVDLLVLGLLATQLVNLLLHRLHVLALTLVHVDFGVFDLSLPLLPLQVEILVSCLEPLALPFFLDNRL